jgi:hypothetical protein
MIMAFGQEMKDFMQGLELGSRLRLNAANRKRVEGETRRFATDEDIEGTPSILEGGGGGGGVGTTSAPQIDTGKTGSTPGGGVANRGGGPFVQQAYNYYRSKGLSHAAAAGWAGNFMQESGGAADVLSGRRRGDNGASAYAAQWQGPRLRNLEAFAKERGHPKPTLEDQFDFALEEGNPDSPYRDDVWAANAHKLTAARTPEEATAIIRQFFERPSANDLHKRVAFAQQAVDEGDYPAATATAGALPEEEEEEEVDLAEAAEESGAEEAEPVEAAEIDIPELPPEAPIPTPQVAAFEEDPMDRGMFYQNGGAIPDDGQYFAAGGKVDPYSPTRAYTQPIAQQPAAAVPRRIQLPTGGGTGNVPDWRSWKAGQTPTQVKLAEARAQQPVAPPPPPPAPVAPAYTDDQRIAANIAYNKAASGMSGRSTPSNRRGSGFQPNAQRQMSSAWNKSFGGDEGRTKWVDKYLAADEGGQRRAVLFPQYGFARGGAIPDIDREEFERLSRRERRISSRDSGESARDVAAKRLNRRGRSTTSSAVGFKSKPKAKRKESKAAPASAPRPSTGGGKKIPIPTPRPANIPIPTPRPNIEQARARVPEPYTSVGGPWPQQEGVAETRPYTFVPSEAPSVPATRPYTFAGTQPTAPPATSSGPGILDELEQSPPAGEWRNGVWVPYDQVGFQRGGAIPDDEEGPYPNWRAEEAGYTTSSADPRVALAARQQVDQPRETAPDQPMARPAASTSREAPRSPVPAEPDVTFPEAAGNAGEAVKQGIDGLKRIFGFGAAGAIQTEEDAARMQDGAARMARGDGAATPEEIAGIDQSFGIDQINADEGTKQMIRLDKTVQWYLQNGDKEKAEAVAASLMMHGANQVKHAGMLAMAAFEEYQQTGDPQDLRNASLAMQKAQQFIPDGIDAKIDIDPNTREIVATTINADGEVNKRVIDPMEVPRLLQGAMDGSQYWKSMFQVGQPRLAEQGMADSARAAKAGEDREYKERWDEYKFKRSQEAKVGAEERAAERWLFEKEYGRDVGETAGERSENEINDYFDEWGERFDAAEAPEEKAALMTEGMQFRYENTPVRSDPLVDEDIGDQLTRTEAFDEEDMPAVHTLARSLGAKNNMLDATGAAAVASALVTEPIKHRPDGTLSVGGDVLVFNPALLPQLDQLRKKYRVQ